MNSVKEIVDLLNNNEGIEAITLYCKMKDKPEELVQSLLIILLHYPEFISIAIMGMCSELGIVTLNTGKKIIFLEPL